MAGTTEPDSEESQRNEGCSFVWDDTTQLYYHPSSGFYHDPAAGWYYSSTDGVYYKFEDGNYVLLESAQGDSSEMFQCVDSVQNSAQDEPGLLVTSPKGDLEAYKVGTVSEEPSAAHIECNISPMLDCPPPPSEWLEDTLIDLYLSGYSNQETDAEHGVSMPMDTDHGDCVDAGNYNNKLQEGEWIPDEDPGVNDSSGIVSDEGTSWEEENWHAQYGQVVRSGEESVPDFQAIDLWDWAMVRGTRRDGKNQVVRLVGRLMRQSARLHPSMPLGGSLLKTAPISEVHLDLVRVTSGQVYKLRSPSARHLASLSTYDSSNPTNDWGFPELSIENQIQTTPSSNGNCEPKLVKGAVIHKDLPSLPGQTGASKNHGGNAYRDRAAERRALHGSFGVGPGQKKSAVIDDSAPSSPVSAEEAAGEALNNSFGVGSYARRILESMGWKEGEALGSSTKGLVEPLKAVGNKGNAGLGWDHSRRGNV
ncbi:uncharacterized protein LOC131310885 isoform X1 [Rhododendron vialii]|uniref:uncharacterized protein LOC131310885 isoform X1 n=1 Tax=Rhododendron vialii TaxID=182163 RepID=UPI00265F0775|nr:uncharacterized protein LOC131310885 isoform X1 [Rhododendron vialii]XP_058194120.1 uncharacterized protein LOC131310885 isoform X1 [Rhododendron vialii]XP_058194121.1 uncharacterized protein LOC131310885 isoform X1 [Rhododendron vialii]